MTRYVCLKSLGVGVVGLSSKFGEQLFTVRKARKPVRGGCADCTSSIKRGDLCWGPITNGMNRMHRICDACILSMIDRMFIELERERHP